MQYILTEVSLHSLQILFNMQHISDEKIWFLCIKEHVSL